MGAPLPPASRALESPLAGGRRQPAITGRNFLLERGLWGPYNWDCLKVAIFAAIPRLGVRRFVSAAPDRFFRRVTPGRGWRLDVCREEQASAFVLLVEFPTTAIAIYFLRRKKALMFAFFNRSRRHVAVLAALAMLASVLVAAPAVAADDPKPSLEATFTACVDVPSAEFTDVPAAHPNAGDIDCIAYYGITKGTSATTYSPLMSVTREHMALFLTRLAARVGIEMTSTPDDPGYTDIGDLSENSQTAIAQLADLGITMGTGTGSTYSPADNVERGHMALFLSRLMNLMTPYGGADSEDAYTPSDVDDEDIVDNDDVGSPYTDINSVTVRTNNAITALYELGVASGISATAYAPTADITRATMAKFMVGVMDHSNLRPAGLSIQASDPSSFGMNEGDAVISVRDDSFAAVADQVVDIFLGDFDEDGACTPDCVWDDGTDEELTDEDGNIVSEGGAARGKTVTYYAWIGSEDEEEFDVDETDHVSVSVESKNEEQAMKVTTSLSDKR